MALNLQDAVGRQYPLVARQYFTYEDLESGTLTPALGLPGNSTVIGGEITITEAFDSTTSDSFDVGDGDNASRYASGVDGQATGRTALTLSGHKYTVPDTVDVTLTSVDGPPSVGAGYVEVHYVIEARANEVQPASA